MKTISIAFAGNPNTGKTTLFNRLTGAHQRVGNWPGVTIDKKEGHLSSSPQVRILDLPGIYSLSPYSPDEVIARNYLLSGEAQVIINVVDATSLERNLYLTTQLCEIGVPLVISLNMIDSVQKQGLVVDTKKLSHLLGCPVVETSALRGIGCSVLVEKAVELANNPGLYACKPLQFSETVERAIASIDKHLENRVPARQRRWYAVKIFERDEQVLRKIAFSEAERQVIETTITGVESAYDDDSDSIIASERYNAIETVLKQCVRRVDRTASSVPQCTYGSASQTHPLATFSRSTSQKVDKILTNRLLALPIFAVTMWAVYYLSIQTIGTWATDWANNVLFGDYIPTFLEHWLTGMNSPEWLVGLVLNGIVAGVGAVLGFLPQMAVLFICLAFLEDCGYMSRIAFIMDRVFRYFGLSGKSFIPLLASCGCGVPGIMACRCIENEQDRKMTILTTTFVPCSAKLPIIALIAGTFFPGSSWVAPMCYFVGIASVLLSGLILKRTRFFASKISPLIMELPTYHLPSARSVITKMAHQLGSFVRRAGTVIFLSSAIIWFLSSYNWRLQLGGMETSMLASIGNVFAFLFTPLGWGDWKTVVASITGLASKENLVSTLGILYGIGGEGGVASSALAQALSWQAGISLLLFNLLCAPCFGSVATIRKETGSWKWTLGIIFYQTTYAYIVALLVFNIFGGRW